MIGTSKFDTLGTRVLWCSFFFGEVGTRTADPGHIGHIAQYSIFPLSLSLFTNQSNSKR